MTERRETARRRVCYGGLVRVATFLPEIACTLRDVSLEGARIRLAPETALPACFDLVVPCRGETRRARLIWRAGDMAGVAFGDAPADSVTGDVSAADLLRRLAESEAEVARLRAALASAGDKTPGRLH